MNALVFLYKHVLGYPFEKRINVEGAQRKVNVPVVLTRDETAKLILLIFFSVFLFGGCAHQQRPVLYPNAFLKSVSPSVAEADINDCIRLAKEYGAAGSKGKDVAINATRNAAVGAATGAAISAVVGGDVGTSAGAGVAGAATATVARGVFSSGEPDPLFRNFVEKCLREKGYEVMGWR